MRARASYLLKGDYDHAIEDYSEAIRLDPKNASAFYHRGYAYRSTDYARAFTDFNEAIRLDPKNAFTFYHRGSAYLATGDYEHAIADFNDAIRLDPKNAVTFSERGKAYRAKDDHDRAIADFNEAIRLNPKNAVTFSERGYAYQAKGDFDHAIADYSEAIRLDPTDAGNYYHQRASAYWYKSDYDHAIADYSEVIRRDPKYDTGYHNRAVAYMFKNDYDHAIADYSEAIRLNPNASGYHSRAMAYASKGDYDSVINDYSEAIRLDPRGGFQRFRGNAYRAKGDYDRAIADYTEVLRQKSDFGGIGAQINMNDGALTVTGLIDGSAAAMAGVRANDIITAIDTTPVKGLSFDEALAKLRGLPDSEVKLTISRKAEPQPIVLIITRRLVHVDKVQNGYVSDLIERGKVYLAMHDYDRAIADFNEAIQLDPKNAFTFYDRGNAYRAKGDHDRAIQDYDQAIKLNPNFARAWNSRCLARAIIGQLEQALRDCTESLRLAPNIADTLDSRALVYLKRGDIENAIADYGAALKVNPKLANSLYGRGVAKQKKGDGAGGESDIAAAKAIDAKIAETFAGYGVSVAEPRAPDNKRKQKMPNLSSAQHLQNCLADYVRRKGSFVPEGQSTAYVKSRSDMTSMCQFAIAQKSYYWEHPRPPERDPSTLICLHPVFTEEMRLRDQIDGNRSTTIRIAQAINYLNAKYCRLVAEIPEHDGWLGVKDNCFQFTGMFRGERVFWGACEHAHSDRESKEKIGNRDRPQPHDKCDPYQRCLGMVALQARTRSGGSGGPAELGPAYVRSFCRDSVRRSGKEVWCKNEGMFSRGGNTPNAR
jgi:tetratricopeptide (TPR) repeat protein